MEKAQEGAQTRPRIAIMTVAIGSTFVEKYNRMFRSGFERYAARLGADLYVIDKPIVPTDKRGWWQKLVPFEDARLAGYDKVAVIDYDIYIPQHAKDVFAAVGDKPWGICKSNPYDLPRNAVEDMKYFDSCPTEGRPPFAANGGMIVLSREYKEPLRKVYDEYIDREARDMEAGPLFYFLWNDGRGLMLHEEFNTPVALWVEKYGCSLSSVMRMFNSASFIHFVGGKWHSIHLFVRWYDQSRSRVAKRLVRFLARPSFDWLTAPLFRLAQRAVGIYDYRIRPRISKRTASVVVPTTTAPQFRMPIQDAAFEARRTPASVS